MCKCLKFNGFFGGLSSGNSNDNLRGEVFVSSLLLRHLQIVSTNGLEIAECILKNNDITKYANNFVLSLLMAHLFSGLTSFQLVEQSSQL